MILLDTNILTTAKQPERPQYNQVTNQVLQYIQQKEELIICPQNLYEFYVVATRPLAQNGFGFSSDYAMNELQDLQNTYSFLNDPPDLFIHWQGIIQQYNTAGKKAHDAKLVAFMNGHGIKQIYTLNAEDFNRYSDIITVLT